MKRSSPREAGFTLIELLVVVLIIGILASIAIPQYFKVVERAKTAEAQAFLSNVKNSNERYLARTGVYVTAMGNLGALDVSFPGSAPNYGMKNFKVTNMAAVATCPNTSDPGYTLDVQRITNNSGVSPRYDTYTMQLSRCTGDISFVSCQNCDQDLQ